MFTSMFKTFDSVSISSVWLIFGKSHETHERSQFSKAFFWSDIGEWQVVTVEEKGRLCVYFEAKPQDHDSSLSLEGWVEGSIRSNRNRKMIRKNEKNDITKCITRLFLLLLLNFSFVTEKMANCMSLNARYARNSTNLWKIWQLWSLVLPFKT